MEAVVYKLHPGTDAHLELEGNDAGLCEIKEVSANGFLSGGVQAKLESICVWISNQVKLQEEKEGTVERKGRKGERGGNLA